MALKTRQKKEWKPLSPQLDVFKSKDLYTRELKVDLTSLSTIARRAILSLKRRQSFHPHLINYFYFINLTILHDKLFQNLSSGFLINKRVNKKSGLGK